MKISPFSPFRTEDFPTQRDWIPTLFLPLNNVLSQVTQALTAQLSIPENIPGFTKVISGSNIRLPQTFLKEGSFTPSQMVVAQAFKAGSPIAMLGAWSVDGDTVTVSQLFEVNESGMLPIDPATKYVVNLRFT